MRKGQMEIIVVVGVLLIMVVVMFYAIQGGTIIPSSVPKGVYDEQREVSNTVKNMVRSSADNTLRTTMMHGGYLEDSSLGVITYNDVPNTEFLLTKVAFWQRCQNVMYPSIGDIEAWMAAAIEKDVREGIGDIEALYGERADFDKDNIRVTVNVLGANSFEPNMVEVSLAMPTTVREYGMAGDLYPYKVKIDSRFGRIYSFGKDFADASAEKRFFDVFSIAAIYFSQELEDNVKLPSMGVLTDCGDVVYRSPEQINNYLLEILEYVLASTLWWQNMPNQGPGMPGYDETLAFAIQNVNGKVYSDLEIRTMMSDDWVFDVFDFVLATNFDMPTSSFYRVPVCTASYNHAYRFSYPFVIRVKDPYTGYSFNFASEVSVGDPDGDDVMEPSDCEFGGVVPSQCQEDLTCNGRVKVEDDLGEPLGGAWVVFGGCPVGNKTDASGYAEGPIKCGTENLYVYFTTDYEFFERTVSATELGDYVVTLGPVNEIRFHFREVGMTKSGYYYTGVDNDNQVHDTCDACSRSCGLTTVTSRKCIIRLVDREHAFVEFDNGYTTLPVTNMDIGGMPEDCGETAGCNFCQEHSDEAETANASVRNDILNACKQCAEGCYTTPLESSLVDYIPSGYTYTTDATMYDPLDNYKTKGVFESESFYLGSDDTEVYIYMPKRSSDRSSWSDFDVQDTEKDCLVSEMQKCGISPVSSGFQTYTSTTVNLGVGCSCSYLKSLADAELSCGATQEEIDGLFCECPEGGRCGQSCGGFGDPCTWCCRSSTEDALSYLETLEESCNTKVICT